MKSKALIAAALVIGWRPGAFAAEGVFAEIEALRPRAAEERWKQIPWVSDVAEAVKAARREHRAILLWVSRDDPLERC